MRRHLPTRVVLCAALAGAASLTAVAIPGGIAGAAAKTLSCTTLTGNETTEAISGCSGTGSSQTGTKGTALPTPLAVTLTPDPSGGTKTGASVLFTTSAGTLSNGTTSGSQVIAVTNSSGVASVTLTLPSTAGPVTVNAQGPYGLGHPVAPAFTETAQ